MYYTYSRNLSKAAIASGRYHNIRMMQFGHNPQQSPTFVVNETRWGGHKGNASLGRPQGFVWASAAEAAATPFPSKKNSWGTYDWAFNSTVLEQFSATCWYFAQALTDELQAAAGGGAAALPIGLIASSVGGTMIESWTPNSTLDECSRASRGSHNAELCVVGVVLR